MVGCVVLSWVDGMITWFAEPKRWIITWFARCETKVVNYYFILEPRI
jgi:3-oxoacyl-ACP reductase-like protein